MMRATPTAGAPSKSESDDHALGAMASSNCTQLAASPSIEKDGFQREAGEPAYLARGGHPGFSMPRRRRTW